jgi:hypothetical protein
MTFDNDVKEFDTFRELQRLLRILTAKEEQPNIQQLIEVFPVCTAFDKVQLHRNTMGGVFQCLLKYFMILSKQLTVTHYLPVAIPMKKDIELHAFFNAMERGLKKNQFENFKMIYFDDEEFGPYRALPEPLGEKHLTKVVHSSITYQLFAIHVVRDITKQNPTTNDLDESEKYYDLYIRGFWMNGTEYYWRKFDSNLYSHSHKVHEKRYIDIKENAFFFEMINRRGLQENNHYHDSNIVGYTYVEQNTLATFDWN